MDDPEERLHEQFEGQKDVEEYRRALQAAIQQSGNPEALTGVGDSHLIEILLDPDVDAESEDEDEGVSDLAPTMLSRMHLLGAITPEEYEERRILSQNRADRMKPEFPPIEGAGSKCVGEFREILLGDDEARPLTPERARRIDEAADVRNKMDSLAKGGKAWDGVTTIQSAVETRQAGDESSGSPSTLSKARKLLPGGS